MRIAFLTEMGFEGKIPSDHFNMRTEFAWMHALEAEHRHINHYVEVRGYDHVFIIFPKGKTFLSAEASKITNGINPVTELLNSDFYVHLKQNNKKIYYIQEGPHWWFNDYELSDQLNFYNFLATCDGIFAHNESDTSYYRGMFPSIPIHVLPSLLIHNTIEDVVPTREEKVFVGGNFARWYGGFESFVVAQEFSVPIWGQTSHAKREGEEQMINLLPRLFWTDWMKALSTFRYAVHLMPTVAAGTFSLNCAYFGIPCIGNEKVDTQILCHPDLAVDVADIDKARKLAKRLVAEPEFYSSCSDIAKQNYNRYYSLKSFKQKLNLIIS
jgi:hypothetical protein